MQMQAKGEAASAPGCAEALSSLIDGELDEGACRTLLERLCGDDEARRQWELLNIACDALRSSDVAALHRAGFVARVSQALASEPAILARRGHFRRASVLRRIVLPTGAAAAAAAVVVLVGIPQLRTQGGPVPAKMVAGQSRDIPAVQVAREATPRVAPDMIRSAELEAYLEAHRERSMGPLAPRTTEYLRTTATIGTEPR